MERWMKIVLGTSVSSVLCVVFFLIYDRIMVYYRKRRHDIDKGSFTLKQVVKKPKKEEERREEMANLLFDEHVSQNHEVICVCSETKNRAFGLCIFLADREIQWYDENFPECCTKDADEQDYSYRNALTAVAHWAKLFTLADAVNLLSPDGKLVKWVCSGTTRQWRSFYQFEKKYSFRLFMQWSENYVCGEVDQEELWEEAVLAAGKLAKGEKEDALRDLPLAGWKIRRVVPGLESFHMVPHPGEITPNQNARESETVGVDSGDESDYGRTLSFTTNERTSLGSGVSSINRSPTSKGRRITSSSLANDLRRSLAEEQRNKMKEDDPQEDDEDDVFAEGAAILGGSAEELLLQL